jgi:hypothetical protein
MCMNCCIDQNAECSAYCYLNVLSFFLNATFIACVHLVQTFFSRILKHDCVLKMFFCAHKYIRSNFSISNSRLPPFPLLLSTTTFAQCEQLCLFVVAPTVLLSSGSMPTVWGVCRHNLLACVFYQW